MSTRRIAILLSALLVGALAVFGIIRYVGQVREEAYAGSEVGTVWVVQEPIPRGTPAADVLAQGWIVEAEIPLQYKPQSAIEDPSVELDGALVAIAELPAGNVVVAGQFVAPSAATTSTKDILEERGLVTVTIQVDQIAGAAHMIEPGDKVNVLQIYDRLETGETAEDDGTDEGNPILVDPNSGEIVAAAGDAEYSVYPRDARYVYQAAEVLAIDQDLPAQVGDVEDENAAAVQANRGLITLAVTPEAAQIILSVDHATLYLSLLPADYQPRPLPPLTEDPLLPGENPEKLTPYGPTGEGDVVADPEAATEGDVGTDQ